MWIENEGRNTTALTKFYGVWCSFPSVVTHQKSDKSESYVLSAWDMTRRKKMKIQNEFYRMNIEMNILK